MTDIPKCTSWLGHKFEGRYDSRPIALASDTMRIVVPTMVGLRMVADVTYERDICIRCGATVEKKP